MEAKPKRQRRRTCRTGGDDEQPREPSSRCSRRWCSRRPPGCPPAATASIFRGSRPIAAATARAREPPDARHVRARLDRDLPRARTAKGEKQDKAMADRLRAEDRERYRAFGKLLAEIKADVVDVSGTNRRRRAQGGGALRRGAGSSPRHASKVRQYAANGRRTRPRHRHATHGDADVRGSQRRLRVDDARARSIPHTRCPADDLDRADQSSSDRALGIFLPRRRRRRARRVLVRRGALPRRPPRDLALARASPRAPPRRPPPPLGGVAPAGAGSPSRGAPPSDNPNDNENERRKRTRTKTKNAFELACHVPYDDGDEEDPALEETRALVADAEPARGASAPANDDDGCADSDAETEPAQPPPKKSSRRSGSAAPGGGPPLAEERRDAAGRRRAGAPPRETCSPSRSVGTRGPRARGPPGSRPRSARCRPTMSSLRLGLARKHKRRRSRGRGRRRRRPAARGRRRT